MIHRDAPRDPLDTTTEIETPEHVRFRHHVAGPAKRAIAYLIDLVIRGAIVFAVLLVVAIAGATDSEGVKHASTGALLLVAFVVEWGYYVFFETVLHGRTPGKQAMSLRVVSEGGQPLGFGSSLLRNLLRA